MAGRFVPSVIERDLLANGAFVGVRHSAPYPTPLNSFNRCGACKRLDHCISVRTDQAARSQFYATVIPHHGCQHPLKILVPEHFQHGPACRAGWFTIIDCGGVASSHQRPADVGSTRMFCLELRYDLDRLLPAVDGADHSDESTLLDDEFTTPCFGNAH